MSIPRAAIAGTLALTLAAAGLTACTAGGDTNFATATVAEDCDAGDQDERDDDCGYWTDGTTNRVGAQPGPTWLWIWYSWVILGRTSYPPPGWTAPKGIRFPTRQVRVPRGNCAMAAAAPAPPRPAAPAPARPAPPRVQNGNQGGGGQPPAAPKPPVFKSPAGQRVAC